MSGKLTTPGGKFRDAHRQPRAAYVRRPTEYGDTIAAWERFLTNGGEMPSGNYVVSSWLRSRSAGVNPTGRAAPIAATGNAINLLRNHNTTLLSATRDVFDRAAETLSGSRTILILTDPVGVVLEVTGDHLTMEQGELIHLMAGGQWHEDRIGTNGIGTALATARPAQVHAAEHFCEGIKSWTCAAAPIFHPVSQEILGVIDISGPPTTYQRTNLNLAVATAREIEAVLAERAMRERAALFEACLQRMSGRDVGGLVAIDRRGTLLHTTGRVAMPVHLGQRIPGLDERTAVANWADHLPPEWRPEWFDPIKVKGETIGALLVVPAPRPRARSGSEADPQRMNFSAILGRNASMRELIERARLLASKHVPVLIEGETGTGKELLARAIHGEADPAKPFVVFNCGAVTKDLVAAELFGHVRGAFTGATTEGRAGRFELADGGVLCLDEIGELPLDVQPFLLRALEEGTIYRVGDTEPRSVSVRLISMTNRALLDDVNAGRFRRDLFYRIGVTRLPIPPLRERGEDILLLAEHFAETLGFKHGLQPRRFDVEAQGLLLRHTWPGNARELRNVVESLLLTTHTDEITAAELRPLIVDSGGAEFPLPTIDGAERTAVMQALDSTGHNVAETARLLGISRSTLYRKAARWGMRL
ncbi:sigma-54-dependent Fis family transcriptional regulator [Rhodopila sp.]|uniref:sigma-54-dependent Fis family transcriptional regulator n=1 Tax=Rhodopila sp. TaxID=2480087 RepID=UPI003D0E243E